jgi:hypothetical protein
VCIAIRPIQLATATIWQIYKHRLHYIVIQEVSSRIWHYQVSELPENRILCIMDERVECMQVSCNNVVSEMGRNY